MFSAFFFFFFFFFFLDLFPKTWTSPLVSSQVSYGDVTPKEAAFTYLWKEAEFEATPPRTGSLLSSNQYLVLLMCENYLTYEKQGSCLLEWSFFFFSFLAFSLKDWWHCLRWMLGAHLLVEIHSWLARLKWDVEISWLSLSSARLRSAPSRGAYQRNPLRAPSISLGFLRSPARRPGHQKCTGSPRCMAQRVGGEVGRWGGGLDAAFPYFNFVVCLFFFFLSSPLSLKRENMWPLAPEVGSFIFCRPFCVKYIYERCHWSCTVFDHYALPRSPKKCFCLHTHENGG